MEGGGKEGEEGKERGGSEEEEGEGKGEERWREGRSKERNGKHMEGGRKDSQT